MPNDHTASHSLLNAFRQLKHIHWGGRQQIDGCTRSETMMLLCVRKGMRLSPSGLKASDLSGFLRVTMPTVSQMVNVLSARGLLERTPDPLDRRIVRIKLTAEGEQLTLETEAAMQRGIQELTEHLGAQRTQQLIDTLEDIYKYYTEGSPNTTPPSEARPNDKSSE